MEVPHRRHQFSRLAARFEETQTQPNQEKAETNRNFK
jgi:hypothetical protein